jgi:hypothetical protein
MDDTIFPKTIILGMHLHGEIELKPPIPQSNEDILQYEIDVVIRKNKAEKQRKLDIELSKADIEIERVKQIKLNAALATTQEIAMKRQNMEKEVKLNRQKYYESLKKTRHQRVKLRSLRREPIHIESEIPKDLRPEIDQLKIKKLIQLNSVRCGVPNVANPITYNALGQHIQDYVNEHPSLDIGIEYVQDIKDILVAASTEDQKEISRQYGYVEPTKVTELPKEDRSRVKSIQEYFHHIEDQYQIKIFNENDTIYNKKFDRLSPEEYPKGMAEELLFFDKMVVYNTSPEKSDIFEFIQQVSGVVYKSVTLFEIIDFFSELGVENIVLIDFSCNSFSYKNKLLDFDDSSQFRIIRSSRKNIEKLKGGRNKSRRLRKSVKLQK